MAKSRDKAFNKELGNQIAADIERRISQGPARGRGGLRQSAKNWIKTLDILTDSAKSVMSNTQVAATWKKGLTTILAFELVLDFVTKEDEFSKLLRNPGPTKAHMSRMSYGAAAAREFVLSRGILTETDISAALEVARSSSTQAKKDAVVHIADLRSRGVPVEIRAITMLAAPAPKQTD
jgi:hypothetical protein